MKYRETKHATQCMLTSYPQMDVNGNVGSAAGGQLWLTVEKSEGTSQAIKGLWAEKCCGVWLTLVQGCWKLDSSISGVICTPALGKIIKRLSLWTSMKATGFDSMGRISSIMSGFLFCFVVCKEYSGKLSEMLQVSVTKLLMLNKQKKQKQNVSISLSQNII